MVLGLFNGAFLSALASRLLYLIVKKDTGKVHIHQSEAIDYIGEIYEKNNLGRRL
jgi:hypothetical protein